MNSYMIERIIGLIITILFAVFFGISTYALYMFENPECYIRIPGVVILGYIIGDWVQMKLK